MIILLLMRTDKKLFSWNRIVSVTAPGMTARNSFYTQPKSFHRTMFFYGFDHVLAAGGCVTAGIW